MIPNRNEKGVLAFIVAWIIIFVINLVFWTVFIWAIINIVEWVTSPAFAAIFH